MHKQNIFDFLQEHNHAIKKAKPDIVFDETVQKKREVHSAIYPVIILDEYREIAVLKYPPRPLEQFLHPEGEALPRFEYTLRGKDFPWRNKIPVYGRDEKGEPVVIEWIDGEDAIPSPSLQRFLDSGEKRYVPKYNPTAADLTDPEISKNMLHGKYHFGGRGNIERR